MELDAVLDIVLDTLPVLLVPVALYVVCAAVPWWVGERCDPGSRVACWRSPLGIVAGLALHVVPVVIGVTAGMLAIRVGGGQPLRLLGDAPLAAAEQAAVLVGTVAGGLGGAAAVGIAYRWRGAGWRGAGLVAVAPGATLRLTLIATAGLLLVATGYNLLFEAIIGRPPASTAEPLVDFARMHGHAWPWLAIVGLSVVVVAPLMEELVYRGVVYRAFRDRAGVGVAIAASGLLFALGHGQLDHIVPLWLFGGALAWLYERSGSLALPIATHAAYNGCALLLELALRR